MARATPTSATPPTAPAPAAATDTNGCDTQSLPLGTKVTFNEGGSLVDEGTQVGTGTLAYSSWLTMQQVGETNADACAYNDLALVKVDAAYVDDVNPSIPFWGGPTGINTTGTHGRRPALHLRQLLAAGRCLGAVPARGCEPR